LLGRPALALPSVFKYIGVIREKRGLGGLYAGFSPRLMEIGVASYANATFNQYWPEPEEPEPLGSADLTDSEERARVTRAVTRGVANRAVVCVATQPFQVVTVRCMAQFVGGESKYDGPIQSIMEVVNENGLLGT